MAGARSDPGYCLFHAERMLALLPRLRAVLPLFAGCTGPRERRRLRRELREPMRSRRGTKGD